jgi:ATP-dependent DNA ligase
LLVNRLRVSAARRVREVAAAPAIYIAFDMLADSGSLLGSPLRLRRKTLERFFENSVLITLPIGQHGGLERS